MNNALMSFKAIIAQTHTSSGLYRYLQEQKIQIDASDLLRWQWVLSISAFDKFIHDIVRIGMVDEFLGKRPETAKFKTFHITMPLFSSIKNSPSPELLFEREIIRQHQMSSFQAPDKVSDALSYIWNEDHKWYVISSNMKRSVDEKALRLTLNNIVIRRNQIVHEGDCVTAMFPMKQQVISEVDTNDVISFISELAEAIYISVK